MLKRLGQIVLSLGIVITSVWACLMLYFTVPSSAATFLAAALALLGLIAIFGMFYRYRQKTLFFLYLTPLMLSFVWWWNISPSNDRIWQEDVALLPYATLEGELVTVHNIRNFKYKSAQDYKPAYYSKTFDLRELDTVDLFNVYWMGPAIAHSMFSFGFSDGSHLAFSIETRKEIGEDYSTIKGFFKQYELYYVVADERDVIGLRTNYREPPEDVYLYRMQDPAEKGRILFMQYINAINQLKQEPKFYNTLLNNCTTTIWLQASENPKRVPFSWKLVANGYLPDYLYQRGLLDTTTSFDELKQLAYINEKAQQANKADDFSSQIRQDIIY